jgi:peptidyl-prolyl cis-trans isomerase A (cyclophilin A)
MRPTFVLACLLALACNSRSEKAAPPHKAPPAKTPQDGATKIEPVTPDGGKPGGATPDGGGAQYDDPKADPEKGEFTMEEALAGLSGSGKLSAKVETSMGDIECQLLPEIAPNTVANFVGLARGTRAFYDLKTGKWTKRPFYDGLIFHRVIPEFMIQGGDPRGTGREGPGYNLKDEFTMKVLFDHGGVMAMANKGIPDSAGSQFFITETAYTSLNGKYAVFGECKNVDVVKKIARAPQGAEPDRPEPEIQIKHIEIFYK